MTNENNPIFSKYNFLCLLYLCIIVSVAGYPFCSAANGYPKKVEVIDKSQAVYDSPENTIAAIYSASLKGDSNWIFQCLTQESVDRIKSLLKEAEMGLDEAFPPTEIPGQEIYIIERRDYRGTVLLMIELRTSGERILRAPSTFIQVNGKWKRTDKFYDDPEFQEFFGYEKIKYTAVIEPKLYPGIWRAGWYNWLKEHKQDSIWADYAAENAAVLCVIKEPADSEGNRYPLDSVIPEYIRLNYSVEPMPWSFMGREKRVVIPGSDKNPRFKGCRGFSRRIRGHAGSCLPEGPCMLVRFNLYKVMESLPDLTPGRDCKVTVSGELENGKFFKGTAEIRLASCSQGFGWRHSFLGMLPLGSLMNEWWNW